MLLNHQRNFSFCSRSLHLLKMSIKEILSYCLPKTRNNVTDKTKGFVS